VRLSARFGLVVLALAVAAPAFCQPMSGPVWVGGSLGLSFGDVDYVEIAPLVGYRVNPDLTLGLGALFRYRDDSRYPGGLSTTDWGASAFGRYHVVPQVFVQGEVEYLSYEYLAAPGTTRRDSETSFLGGGGFAQPLGGAAVLELTVLYNFSYSSSDLIQPYASPWVYRLGVRVGL